jgi:hypothetical protein
VCKIPTARIFFVVHDEMIYWSKVECRIATNIRLFAATDAFLRQRANCRWMTIYPITGEKGGQFCYIIIPTKTNSYA